MNDILVGVAGNDSAGSEAGAVYLVLGASLSTSGSLADADTVFYGAAEGDELGYAVSGVNDVDFDGFDDVLITAPMNDRGAADAGAVYLFFGQTLRAGTATYDLAEPVYDYRITGQTSSDHFGTSACGPGDVDGDGFSDLLIGAHLNGAYGGAYLALSPGE